MGKDTVDASSVFPDFMQHVILTLGVARARSFCRASENNLPGSEHKDASAGGFAGVDDDLSARQSLAAEPRRAAVLLGGA